MREVRSDIVIVGVDAASLGARPMAVAAPLPRRARRGFHGPRPTGFSSISICSQSNALDDAVPKRRSRSHAITRSALRTFFQRSNGDDGTLSVSKAAAQICAPHRERGRQR